VHTDPVSGVKWTSPTPEGLKGLELNMLKKNHLVKKLLPDLTAGFEIAGEPTIKPTTPDKYSRTVQEVLAEAEAKKKAANRQKKSEEEKKQKEKDEESQGRQENTQKKSAMDKDEKGKKGQNTKKQSEEEKKAKEKHKESEDRQENTPKESAMGEGEKGKKSQNTKKQSEEEKKGKEKDKESHDRQEKKEKEKDKESHDRQENTPKKSAAGEDEKANEKKGDVEGQEKAKDSNIEVHVDEVQVSNEMEVGEEIELVGDEFGDGGNENIAMLVTDDFLGDFQTAEKEMLEEDGNRQKDDDSSKIQPQPAASTQPEASTPVMTTMANEPVLRNPSGSSFISPQAAVEAQHRVGFPSGAGDISSIMRSLPTTSLNGTPHDPLAPSNLPQCRRRLADTPGFESKLKTN
jgi:hypothetical protein